MSGEIQSRHCLWLMLVVSLAHNRSGQAAGAWLMAEPAVVVSFYFLLLTVVAPAALTVFLPPTPILLTGPACALGTVLVLPLVKAVPPMRKLLIAMPGLVFVTVRPSLKTVPASANGPGPAATVLVVPKKLNPAFKLPGPPALIVLLPPPTLRTKFKLLPGPPTDSSFVLPPMFLAPLRYPPSDVTVLPLPTRLLARSELPPTVVTLLPSPNRFRAKFPEPPVVVTVLVLPRRFLATFPVPPFCVTVLPSPKRF